jgi:glycosyltransferase involved in cell wall biosynthesis
MPVVSISESQRAPLPWLNWLSTVYHGLPLDLYRFREQAGQYLAFLGRISPEKRVDRAINIARRLDMPLKIAAKIDRVDADYFATCIQPLLADPLIEYVGEIGDHEKDEFLGNARALLFPIDWPEPFGLAMIEALACGTPVVAYKRGSVPEVIEHGVTGFIVSTIEEAIACTARIQHLDRSICRRVFEERFSAPRMVSGYLSTYERRIGYGSQVISVPLETATEAAFGSR